MEHEVCFAKKNPQYQHSSNRGKCLCSCCMLAVLPVDACCDMRLLHTTTRLTPMARSRCSLAAALPTGRPFGIAKGAKIFLRTCLATGFLMLYHHCASLVHWLQANAFHLLTVFFIATFLLRSSDWISSIYPNPKKTKRLRRGYT